MSEILHAKPDPTLLVDEKRTILVTIWRSGKVTIATREHSDEIWGPPIELKETT